MKPGATVFNPTPADLEKQIAALAESLTVLHATQAQADAQIAALATGLTAESRTRVQATSALASSIADATMAPALTGVERGICGDLAGRQHLGVKKYGLTVADNPLSPEQWEQHLYEELLDAAIYLKRRSAPVPVRVRRLRPEAKMPTYAHDGDGCFDLYAADADGSQLVRGESWVLHTGLAFEIPVGYVMLVFSRSGHGFKHGVRLANCVGVIDAGFRGEVKVALTCDEDDAWNRLAINSGDRIAQAMVVPRPTVRFLEVDELGQSTRGEGGFGSSGA